MTVSFLKKKFTSAHLPTLELLVHRETPDNKQSLTLSLNSSTFESVALYTWLIQTVTCLRNCLCKVSNKNYGNAVCAYIA